MTENTHISSDTFTPYTVDVELWQLKFFAKAVGETNPIYYDEEAAKSAGYRSIMAPPTYAVTLSSAVPDPFVRPRAMGMDLTKLLHTRQRFDYFEPIFGRDRITFAPKIVDAYEKARGRFRFMVEETLVTNQFGVRVALLKQTLVEQRT